MSKKPLCITFAGPPGSSKTPVAYYLSWNLGLPIFNNDAIRSEVQEDTLSSDFETAEYYERRNRRLEKLISSRKSFILDASVDRTWPEVKKALSEHGYEWCVISFNLSLELLSKMAIAKGYIQDKELWTKWHAEHEKFLKNFSQDVSLAVADPTFSQRLELSLEAARGTKSFPASKL